MPMHSGKQRGFTLIDLADIVAIIGSLIAVASLAHSSAKQDTRIQSDVSTGLRLVHNLQGTIEAYHRRTGTWPSAANLNDLAAIPTVLSPVRSIVIRASGVIELEFDGNDVAPSLRMTTLDITPYSSGRGDVLWQCGGPWTLSPVICGQPLTLDTKM